MVRERGVDIVAYAEKNLNEFERNILRKIYGR